MAIIKSVGIIGLGSFGQLVASLLPKDVEIWGHDPKQTSISGVQSVSLLQVAKADVIVLAMPLSAYDSVLSVLAKHTESSTLLVDACSVKLKPTQLINHHLPNHPNLLMTHPLFGPETIQNHANKHVLVVTEKRGAKADHVLLFCGKFGLRLQYLTADAHDREMAQIHALTFFIGRGLTQFGVTQNKWQTPSYQSLVRLAWLDQKHSQELFETIENGNPYAKAARKKFLASLTALNNSLL